MKPWGDDIGKATYSHNLACKQIFSYLRAVEETERRNVIGLLSTTNTIQLCWLNNRTVETLMTCQSIADVPTQCEESFIDSERAVPTLCLSDQIACNDPKYIHVLCTFLLRCAWSSNMAPIEGVSSWCQVLTENTLITKLKDKLPLPENAAKRLKENITTKRNNASPDSKDIPSWPFHDVEWSQCFAIADLRVIRHFLPGGDGIAQHVVPACCGEEFDRIPTAVVKFFFPVVWKEQEKGQDPKELEGKQVQQEVEKFNLVNAHLPDSHKAFARKLNGQEALVMPYCRPLEMFEFEQQRSVLKQFLTDLRRKNIAYLDLKRQHVTMFDNHLVLIDTCRVHLQASSEDLNLMF